MNLQGTFLCCVKKAKNKNSDILFLPEETMRKKQSIQRSLLVWGPLASLDSLRSKPGALWALCLSSFPYALTRQYSVLFQQGMTNSQKLATWTFHTKLFGHTCMTWTKRSLDGLSFDWRWCSISSFTCNWPATKLFTVCRVVWTETGYTISCIFRSARQKLDTTSSGFQTRKLINESRQRRVFAHQDSS